MQAAIPRPSRATIAAPFGRPPVLYVARVSSVTASSHAMLALPRVVARICPPSAPGMAIVPTVFSDMTASRFGKHGRRATEWRRDQRQAGEQDQYQHHFAK